MKKGFSLIELLIVVLIVGVVYTLAIGSFDNLKTNKAKPTLLNLKSYLSKIKHEKNVKLICLDSCESCSVFVDGEINEELSDKFDGFLDKSVNVHSYNINTGLQSVSDSVYFNSENVSQNICFSYTLDKKGIGSQVIVEYKKSIYDFTSSLGTTQKYASTEEFIDAKQKLVNEVLN